MFPLKKTHVQVSMWCYLKQISWVLTNMKGINVFNLQFVSVARKHKGKELVLQCNCQGGLLFFLQITKQLRVSKWENCYQKSDVLCNIFGKQKFHYTKIALWFLFTLRVRKKNHICCHTYTRIQLVHMLWLIVGNSWRGYRRPNLLSPWKHKLWHYQRI